MRARTRVAGVVAAAAALAGGVVGAGSALADPPALYGPIHDYYWAHGGPAGALGARLTGIQTTAGATGRYTDFTGGRVTFRFAPTYTAPRTVKGAIESRFFADGAVTGVGYPLTEEAPAGGGGRFQVFERGHLYWSPAVGAHDVHGAIYGYWAGHGWENGALGYPTGEEGAYAPVAGARVQTFQHATVYWTAERGVSTTPPVAPPPPPPPPPAPPAPPAPPVTRYPNCAAMHQDYPYGVRLPGAVDLVGGQPNPKGTKAVVNAPVYNANTALDRDKDGVACETP